MPIMKNPLSLFHLESSACLSVPVEINNLRENTGSKRRFQQLFQNLGLAVLVAVIASTPLKASIWTGGAGSWSGNWSSNGSPGWNGTGVPNLAGATANFTTNGSTGTTVTLDQTAIIGSLNYSGAGSGGLSFTLTNAFTLNNSGSGAILSNTSTGTASRISFGSGSIVLADNLTISNTNANITATQSILTGASTIISGSGNITFSNVKNSITDGAIVLGGASTFTGNVLVEKGAVTYSSSSTGLGNSANAVTLGSAGNGSASLISTSSGTAATLANNITVASGTGGTLLLGSSGTGTTNTTYSGTLLLNGNLSVTSSKPTGNDVRFTNVISGAGSITTVGTGEVQFGNGTASITNTYAGNTTLTETSSLVLSDNAKMTFYIGATGVNNKIAGTAGQFLTLDGDFVFDLSIAGTTPGNSWTIVDVGSLTDTFSGTFTVTGFVDAGSNLWTKDINGTNYYRFSESTGVLAVVPEPATWGLLAFSLTTVLVFRRRSIS